MRVVTIAEAMSKKLYIWTLIALQKEKKSKHHRSNQTEIFLYSKEKNHQREKCNHKRKKIVVFHMILGVNL